MCEMFITRGNWAFITSDNNENLLFVSLKWIQQSCLQKAAEAFAIKKKKKSKLCLILRFSPPRSCALLMAFSVSLVRNNSRTIAHSWRKTSGILAATEALLFRSSRFRPNQVVRRSPQVCAAVWECRPFTVAYERLCTPLSQGCSALLGLINPSADWPKQIHGDYLIKKLIMLQLSVTGPLFFPPLEPPAAHNTED